MQPEIQEVIRLVRENSIWKVVEPYVKVMFELEEDHPDALRQNIESPTSVQAKRGCERTL